MTVEVAGMRRFVLRLALVALLALAVAAAPARAGGPHMLVGAVAQEAVAPTAEGAATVVRLAANAGLGAAMRVALLWARGESRPSASTIAGLRNAAIAAQADGTVLYASVFPYGSSQTPVTGAQQAQFVAWLTAIARAVPQVTSFIVGNEPNLNRYWLPQFGPDGEDVAAPAYESLLARAYDGLKAVSPTIQVLGGALSHAGVDVPNTGRDTHSPTAFITDLGAAYRASGRTEPIMDAFSFHPYMLNSSEPPTTQHPNSTTITIADYDKLVALLGQAFDGTAQLGSTLPIVYDEFGVESTVPAAKASLYTGKEPATTHPVDEATQAQYYRDAFTLAYCQPNVRTILVFSLIDEQNLLGWQSGVYYEDRAPKQSLPAVRAAALAVARNTIASCPGLQVTPRLTPTFPLLSAAPAAAAVVVRCDVDCTYHVRLERVPSHATVVESYGRAVGGTVRRVPLRHGRLRRGAYRFTISASAVLNRGGTARAASRPSSMR